ncbi:MAG: hypothetical protein U5K79_06990 [Cyclobacteriaceae bacterium]|nr:hypothetical protein [Cyclobacteriaceae bacterium]
MHPVNEKAFAQLNESDGGVDSTFSMEPAEMKALVVESERAFLALGYIQTLSSEGGGRE